MDKVLPSGKIMRNYRIKRTKKHGYILQHQLCWVWLTLHRNLEETYFSCGELETLVFRVDLDTPVKDWEQLHVRLVSKEQIEADENLQRLPSTNISSQSI